MTYDLDVKDWQIEPPAEPEEEQDEQEYDYIPPWEMEW